MSSGWERDLHGQTEPRHISAGVEMAFRVNSGTLDGSCGRACVAPVELHEVSMNDAGIRTPAI